MSTSKIIHDLRVDKDLTQQEVATILEISQQYYSRYEKGEIDIPIRHLITLSEYYKVSLEYLCGLPEIDTRIITKRGYKPSKEILYKAYSESAAHIQEAILKLLKL